jgi:hypothetical protein
MCFAIEMLRYVMRFGVVCFMLTCILMEKPVFKQDETVLIRLDKCVLLLGNGWPCVSVCVWKLK